MDDTDSNKIADISAPSAPSDTKNTDNTDSTDSTDKINNANDTDKVDLNIEPEPETEEDIELQMRSLLRKLNPCVDLVEKITRHITNNYIAPVRNFVKEHNIQEPNVLMMNLTKLIYYIGQDFIAVEYIDDILSEDERDLLESLNEETAAGEETASEIADNTSGETQCELDEAVDEATDETVGKAAAKTNSPIHFMVQTTDYSDTELSVPEFICKVLGLNLADYNPTVTLTCDSRDVENLFLPTNDAVLKLADLGYNFTAEESVMGFNSGFITFNKGTFHRMINCRFHYVENDNLKTRIARWIDFYPCKYERFNHASIPA